MSIEEPGSPREWLIRKGGYFYRPGKSGYTTVKSQAGRYTELEARREAEIEPWHMDAIHQDMVPDPAGDINVSEIASLKAILAATQEENRRLVEALKPFAEWFALMDVFYADQSDDAIAAGNHGFYITFGHLRRAARSLAPKPTPDHGAAG